MQMAPKGLKGLIVAETSVGAVHGSEGWFQYRGHNAAELATTERFETVASLLLGDRDGSDLDDSDRAKRDDGFTARLAQARVRAFERLAPTYTLRAGVSEALDDTPSLDLSAEQRRDAVLCAAGAMPVIVAAKLRRSRGDEPIAPDPTLPHAADYLRMITGVTPSPQRARALETYLALTMDHGMNASTFTARVIASTGASVSAAIVGGLGALSGPLHGGAPSRVLEMVEEIGDPLHAETWARGALARGKKIMGFGHAVYRADDPRSTVLRRVAHELGGALVERAVKIEEAILAVLRAHKPSAVIVTNVEYYAALVLHLSGIPKELFTPTFAVSRCFGWGAHILEQAEQGKIMRPSSRYVAHVHA